MSTEKQKEYITKLSQWKGQSIPTDKIEKLTETEASTLIDSLKAMKSVSTTTTTRTTTNNNAPINQVRFGLACKLVIQKQNLDSIFRNREAFIETVHKLYNLIAEAETSSATPQKETDNTEDMLHQCLQHLQTLYKEVA